MTKYYIYHIKGKKIGCTKNPSNRIKQQTCDDYEILEIHTDIDIASDREMQLQKQYGYKIDTSTYRESVENFKIESVVKAGRARGQQSIQTGHLARLTEKQKKPVLQYTLEGHFIKEWESAAEAIRQTKIGHIRVCARGEIKYAGGYVWKYKS